MGILQCCILGTPVKVPFSWKDAFRKHGYDGGEYSEITRKVDSTLQKTVPEGWNVFAMSTCGHNDYLFIESPDGEHYFDDDAIQLAEKWAGKELENLVVDLR